MQGYQQSVASRRKYGLEPHPDACDPEREFCASYLR